MLTVIKTSLLMIWWEHLQKHGYWLKVHWFSSETTPSPKTPDELKYWQNNFLFFNCYFFPPPWSYRSEVTLHPKAFLSIKRKHSLTWRG